jgi:hypothetical protein
MNAAPLPSAARLLLWCLAGTLVVALVLARAAAEGNPLGFSASFWYLLRAYDAHGNFLLAALALVAFLLRRQPAALAAVRVFAEHPWRAAAAAFPLLCIGSLVLYRAHPLSMDEYAVVFQANAFAAGRLAGAFPPELVDRLIPPFLQGVFLTVTRASGEVSSAYWPGFALLLAPFAWLGAPWAANPAIGALTLPAVHRLTHDLTGSREAAGWATALTAASPAFVAESISFYSMPAHLLCNLLYATLLLRPSNTRALLAGLIGSLALTLHQPVSHLLFALPFTVWLLFRPDSRMALVALIAGYFPLSLVLGLGWHAHLQHLASTAATVANGAASTDLAAFGTVSDRFLGAFTVPQRMTIEARIAGLSKVWTWGAMGLLVLAAYGYRALRGVTGARLLAAALLVTYFGYFLFSRDQGHGWGYRYLHSAWFVLPVLAAAALALAEEHRDPPREMAAWGIVLSLLLANGLRLTQVHAFVDGTLRQVPPLAHAESAERPELVFVEVRRGFYTQDLVQNHPFLRSPRITMTNGAPADNARLAAQWFPGYVKTGEGAWGELWTPAPTAPSKP